MNNLNRLGWDDADMMTHSDLVLRPDPSRTVIRPFMPGDPPGYDKDHPRVQRVADQLERAGLVTYRPHPVDGRTQLVELTPAGSQVLEAIYTQQLSWSERIVEQLNSVQLERTVRALDRVSGVLEADLPTTKPDSHRRTS